MSDAPVASAEHTAAVARGVVTISLAVASLGQSIPFGAATGPFTFDINPLEVVLSVLLFLTGIGLLVDFFHPWRSWLWRNAVAEMVAGAIWVAIGTYELLAPNQATLGWRLGHALPAYGWAILALTTWRWINVGRLRQ